MTQKEKKRAQQYFSLQPSEMAVFKCASQIFAAYICSGKVTDKNKSDYYRIAIRDAMRIGAIVEKSIESDDELPASKGKSGVF
jgi:hypothetical protein